ASARRRRGRRTRVRDRNLEHGEISTLISQEESPIFGKPFIGFATQCSDFGHGGLREPTPVDSLGIARHFFQAGMAGDRRDLVYGASGLRQTARGGLAQAVGATAT